MYLQLCTDYTYTAAATYAVVCEQDKREPVQHCPCVKELLGAVVGNEGDHQPSVFCVCE
jgi:hypothetical protein